MKNSHSYKNNDNNKRNYSVIQLKIKQIEQFYSNNDDDFSNNNNNIHEKNTEKIATNRYDKSAHFYLYMKKFSNR